MSSEIINKTFKWKVTQACINEMNAKTRSGKYASSPWFEVCEFACKDTGFLGFVEGVPYFQDAVNERYGPCDFIRKGAAGYKIHSFKYDLMKEEKNPDESCNGLIQWDFVGKWPGAEMFGAGFELGRELEFNIIQFHAASKVLSACAEQNWSPLANIIRL